MYGRGLSVPEKLSFLNEYEPSTRAIQSNQVQANCGSLRLRCGEVERGISWPSSVECPSNDRRIRCSLHIDSAVCDRVQGYRVSLDPRAAFPQSTSSKISKRTCSGQISIVVRQSGIGMCDFEQKLVVWSPDKNRVICERNGERSVYGCRPMVSKRYTLIAHVKKFRKTRARFASFRTGNPVSRRTRWSS